MSSESDFAGIQGQQVDQSYKALQAWAAQKFGALLDTYKPNANELYKIQAYYDAHPGAPTSEFVTLLAAQRGQKPPSAATVKSASSVAASPASATSAVASAPGTTMIVGADLPKGAAGSLTAAAAKAIKDAQTAGTTGPIMGTASPSDPVYLQSTTSAPDAGLSPGVRQHLSPEDQLATGTGQQTGVTAITYQDALLGPYKMSADELTALKQQLWAGGFYPKGTDPSTVKSSTPDIATLQAYQLAVDQSARYAQAGKQITIQQIIALGNPDPAKSTGASSLGPYTVTNPIDLKTALQSAAQQHLGRDLTPAEMGDFAKVYNGMEASASLRQQAANASNTQLGITAPPTATSAASDYISSHFAAAQQAYGAVQQQQAFYSMLGAV